MVQAASLLGMSHLYNKNSSTQGNVVSACHGILSTAAQACPLPADGHLVVAEWGCSHGANSIAPLKLIAEVLQQRLGAQSDVKHLDVQVFHEDVPQNDFTALFRCAAQYKQQLAATCPQLSLLPSAVGVSMYERNLPDASVDLGFSFTALHWQSQQACMTKHACNFFCNKVLPEERQQLQASAIADLTNFLTLRAKEFKKGGLLVLSYVAEDAAKGCIMSEHSIFNAVQEAAEQLVAEGLIEEAELGLMALPTYCLDVAVQREAVYQQLSDVWLVLSMESMMARAPEWEDYKQGRVSRQQQAQMAADAWRAVAQPFIEEGLAASGRRSPQQVQELVDLLFSRMAAGAEASPMPVEFPTVNVLLMRR